MAVDEVDRYITYEGRLASFQKTAKKRGSTASGRAKALAWPHKQIAPASVRARPPPPPPVLTMLGEQLAKAGFYFDPQPASPDNVTCFLCGKGLDGWEAGDDPLLEHLKHASHCGWAIVSAIQAEVGNYAHLDPISPNMTEARKATFAGIWPHEVKKGWKCKTKQVGFTSLPPSRSLLTLPSSWTRDGNTHRQPSQTTWRRAPTASWRSMDGSPVTSHSESCAPTVVPEMLTCGKRRTLQQIARVRLLRPRQAIRGHQEDGPG